MQDRIAAIRDVAVLGTGTIGASWVALFLANGLTVRVYDPNPAGEQLVRDMIARAWPALLELGLLTDGANPDGWSFHTDPCEAVRGADLVQENAPEREEIKKALFASIETVLGDHTIVASSTSGLIMSRLQEGRHKPDRYAVGHPFNPPHLIPLVEVVGGKDTSEDTIATLMAFYRHIGKYPIRLHREVPGHLANRLQAAIWREVVHAVASGMASVEDVDAAIAQGPGVRWAVMGPNMLFNLAGGDGGMKHFLDHLGPALESWWADLGAPHLTAEVNEALIKGVTDATHGRSTAEILAERDAKLMAVLKALR